MKTYFSLILMLLCTVLYTGCKETRTTADATVLMQVDRDFSLYSVKYGMKKAFLFYADTAVALLRPNHYPIEGKNNLRETQKTVNDSLFTLKWEPLHAAISASADLGFTYGVYELIPRDTSNGNKIEKGSYITVWKRQADGSWKFAFDAGNRGL